MKKTLIFLSLIIFGCKKNQETQDIKYFDLKGLVSTQIELLNRSQPRLKKIWQIGRKEEHKEFEKTDWSRELEVFQEADINKSGLKNSYEIFNNENSEKYTLKKGENAPVKYLLVKKDIHGNPEIIEMESSMNNYLFDSKTTLILRFESQKLKSFSAQGYQKLFFGKADSTKIQGIIL